MNDRVVAEEMRAYYEARAAEYDDWWLGAGRFTSRKRPGWKDEVHLLKALLRELEPCRTLDVACGTAFLTRHLQGEVTALDQSASMCEIAECRMPDARVVQGDALPLPFPDDSFDRVITAHFYGHLLEHERGPVLAELRRVAREVLIIDSRLRDDVQPEQWEQRILDDGSTHQVYKRFFTGESLSAELGTQTATVLHDGDWFVAVASVI